MFHETVEITILCSMRLLKSQFYVPWDCWNHNFMLHLTWNHNFMFHETVEITILCYMILLKSQFYVPWDCWNHNFMFHETVEITILCSMRLLKSQFYVTWDCWNHNFMLHDTVEITILCSMRLLKSQFYKIIKVLKYCRFYNKITSVLQSFVQSVCFCGCIYSPFVDVTIVLAWRVHRIHKQTVVICTFMIQGVPLATEPGISLIILTQMKILQRNLNSSTFFYFTFLTQ
jgi:hypothetical protein